MKKKIKKLFRNPFINPNGKIKKIYRKPIKYLRDVIRSKLINLFGIGEVLNN